MSPSLLGLVPSVKPTVSFADGRPFDLSLGCAAVAKIASGRLVGEVVTARALTPSARHIDAVNGAMLSVGNVCGRYLRVMRSLLWCALSGFSLGGLGVAGVIGQ
jgi:hypothetical protein